MQGPYLDIDSKKLLKQKDTSDNWAWEYGVDIR